MTRGGGPGGGAGRRARARGPGPGAVLKNKGPRTPLPPPPPRPPPPPPPPPPPGAAPPPPRPRPPPGAGPPSTNRLILETSPYLLQHAHNPVDWYPWGDEAFARGAPVGQPVFLSIGYSTCHWCHVMEGESFEDEEIARFMNEHYVCIKVDREERPDVDAIYMTAVQALTGVGRLADERLAHAGARAVLRRHLLPAARRRARRAPRLPHGAGRAAADLPEGSRAPGREALVGWRCARRWTQAGDGPPRPGAAVDRARPSTTSRRLRRRARRRAPRAQVSLQPPGAAAAALPPPHRRRRGAADGDADAGEDGGRRACTTSSAAAFTATRPTRAGWCRTSRRCSTTTRSWPSPTPRRTR